MRPATRARLVPLATATLLLGCGDGETLAPAAPDARGAASPGGQIAAPSNVTAIAASTREIRVAWQDNSTNELGFEVYRTRDAGAVWTTAANATTLLDGGLAEGTEYCYMVRATRRKGNALAYSDWSGSACAATLTPPVPPPTVATLLDVRAHASDDVTVVTVHWANGQADWRQVSRVDHSLDGGATWQAVGTWGSTRDQYASDNYLETDREYCYRVVNSTSSGTAAPSNVLCATTVAAPTELTVTTVDDSTVDIAWRDNSVVEDRYQLRALVPTCTWDPEYGEHCEYYVELVATLPANATSHRTRSRKAIAWGVGALLGTGESYSPWVEVPTPAP